ncbi:micro-fibrillar-associated protein, putative [Plasmodium berghei]|uniref:Micro-fibrillar-associated protein, putative n=2 Tax=Plasmodium berghei TaxID=5821 RepID=A0A509AR06_PLABA|nr:micro-fibrillar-associated protein, putative [Plasmodium berghei ANKA]CXI98544.1 micro-fibrillar-associated protein, putative [Plasmodium berghei]SCL97720.1 micro-fibrillar-associated protein, putative [Plasmodium berghei]SCM16668.1 micro-fibrillar-associated protein, putative [Plasmodium berghei]SCM18465.1 micro-fibrillar-associated protein, putative [Plasmodium berghei]SCN27896.1 micro-fibrillar-associated protein, putative [Plasmodium berghei]|eukprot:XP_034423550.1 micro-fibrillar-associated protein, putative [Plasmodium berghei ANKA]
MSTINELLSYFVGENQEQNEINENDEKEKRENITVKRYFPGKKPHYAKDSEEEDQIDDEEDNEENRNQLFTNNLKNNKRKDPQYVEIPTGVHVRNDETKRRYERLKNIKTDVQQRVERRMREVTVLSHVEEEKKEEKKKEDNTEEENIDEENIDEENIDEENIEEENKNENDNESESESESEDSYLESENDNSDSVVKHEFVSKKGRKTLLENLEKEEKEKKKLENINSEKELINIEKKENVIKETLNAEIMEEILKNKKNNFFSSEEDFEDDEKNEELNEKEYELWKARHFERLKRDELERKKHEILKEEIKERRNMTDKEIIEQNKHLPHKANHNKKKKKILFMQKYYHKGGFYQDLFEEGKEEIYRRDYNEPTYEDKIDKEKLPKVLQLRRGNFGKQGQTKYTHLLDNDTSKKDSLWNNPKFNSKNNNKKQDLFDRPTYKKK